MILNLVTNLKSAKFLKCVCVRVCVCVRACVRVCVCVFVRPTLLGHCSKYTGNFGAHFDCRDFTWVLTIKMLDST